MSLGFTIDYMINKGEILGCLKGFRKLHLTHGLRWVVVSHKASDPWTTLDGGLTESSCQDTEALWAGQGFKPSVH